MLEQLKEVLSKLRRVKLLTWFSLVIATALLIVIGVWLTSWGLTARQDWVNLQQNPTDATKKQFDASLEIVKAIVGFLGTLATIIGGIFLYLNFRVANRNVELTESRLTTERFSKAVEQLGSDQLEVRLGGIYSLEKIVEDSGSYHWTIMEVLLAFVRERSLIAEPKTKKSLVEHYQQQSEMAFFPPAVTQEVQEALTVIGRRDSKKDQGKIVNLFAKNLSCAVLIDAQFNDAFFEGAIFHGAILRGAQLNGAKFLQADLSFAQLNHAHLKGADLRFAILYHTDFSSADLTGANLSYTKLGNAKLNGAKLNSADLAGANLSSADLTGADLNGAKLNGVNFSGVFGLLPEEQLKEARLCQTTMPDGTINNRDCQWFSANLTSQQ